VGLLWAQRVFDGMSCSIPAVRSVVVTATNLGSLVPAQPHVVVKVRGAPGNSGGARSPAITIAYDAATGRRVWVDRFADVMAHSLAVSPDGSRAYVVGEIFDDDSRDVVVDCEGTCNYITIAYDAATGRRVWATQHRVLRNAFSSADAVAVSPDGQEVYVSGTADSWGAGPTDGGSTEYVTLAYRAASGKLMWRARRESGGHKASVGVVGVTAATLSRDGQGLYVTGVFESCEGAAGVYARCNLDYGTVGYRIR